MCVCVCVCALPSKLVSFPRGSSRDRGGGLCAETHGGQQMDVSDGAT